MASWLPGAGLARSAGERLVGVLRPPAVPFEPELLEEGGRVVRFEQQDRLQRIEDLGRAARARATRPPVPSRRPRRSGPP